MESTTVITRNCAIAAGCARHDASFRADSLRCRSLGKRCRPRGAADVLARSHARPATLPCCRRAALPAGCRRAARGAAGRSTPGRLPHAPGRSLGKHCRPRGAAGQDRPHAPGPVVLPTCCAPGRLPTCCPWSTPGRLPHAPGRSLGKHCRPVVLPVKIGPTLPARGAADVLRCRPVADVLPVVLPAVNSRPVAPRSRPVTRGSVAGPVVLPVKIGPTLPARGAADVLRSRPVADVLPVVLPPVNSRPVAPRSRPVTREALPAPWCCPVKIGPTLPAPWCCRRAALPAGCRRAARGAAGRQLPAGCPTLPAGHSGSVAGPVVLPVKIGPTLPAPWCCRRAALPAGCRRAARGAAGRSTPGRSLGKRCRPRGAAGQDRPHAPGPWCCRRAALPGRLPTCCPWCCRRRPAPGRSLGKRCRPVVLPVKIGPTLPARGAADVLRSRPVADVLPVVLRPVNSAVAPRSRPVTREALPAPWCCPVKIGPTLPARGAADVLRCRPVADVLPVVLPTCRAYRCAGRSDFAGCAGAILGSLTVLRGSPEKPCAGFSPGQASSGLLPISTG